MSEAHTQLLNLTSEAHVHGIISMTVPSILLLLLPALSSAASSSLQFLPVPNATVHGATPLPNGSVAVFGSVTNSCAVNSSRAGCIAIESPLLSVLDVSGNETTELSSSALGSGNSAISGAVVDASGNIWITGDTDSDDFPLVHPLFSAKPAYKRTYFAARLDPALNILFSTFLGTQVNQAIGASAPRIALDSAGNAYVVGNTDEPGFPTTGPVFGVGTPVAWGILQPRIYTFVSKLSSDGSRLIYSRLLGGNGSPCNGGSSCTFYLVSTTPSAIAVDANGNLTVAGSTNATNFPITANVYQTGGGAFVTQISADGSQLNWSTEIGVAARLSAAGLLVSTAQSIALDAAGNVYVAGSAPTAIPTTPGALQPTVQPGPGSQGTGFAAKLSPDATQLLFATNLGGTNGATLAGLALDPGGNMWIAGNTRSSDFPGLPNTTSSGLDFALELDANATRLQRIVALVPGTVTQPPAFDSDGRLVLPAAAGNILRLDPATALTAPAVFAITNAAVPMATAGVATGEIATIYGVGIGPAASLVGGPDKNGLYPTQLGGVTVDFGPANAQFAPQAPLLYVGPDQINFQVPFRLSNPINVTVTTPTGKLPAMHLALISSIGIFGVLNQDGTLNSASNPAQAGSIVSLYATGLGSPSFLAPDGAVSPSANSAFQNSVEVGWQGSLYALPLWYAGTAPGLINGLDQLNVQLPTGVQNPTLIVRRLAPANGSATATSNPMLVYAR